jgi:hypothetical protein
MMTYTVRFTGNLSFPGKGNCKEMMPKDLFMMNLKHRPYCAHFMSQLRANLKSTPEA